MKRKTIFTSHCIANIYLCPKQWAYYVVVIDIFKESRCS
jgi:hypothetical protein